VLPSESRDKLFTQAV